jgi:hypothetical protein
VVVGSELPVTVIVSLSPDSDTPVPASTAFVTGPL